MEAGVEAGRVRTGTDLGHVKRRGRATFGGGRGRRVWRTGRVCGEAVESVDDGREVDKSAAIQARDYDGGYGWRPAMAALARRRFRMPE